MKPEEMTMEDLKNRAIGPTWTWWTYDDYLRSRAASAELARRLEESERKLESARSDIEMTHFLLDQERPDVRGALVLLRRLRRELGGEG